MIVSLGMRSCEQLPGSLSDLGCPSGAARLGEMKLTVMYNTDGRLPLQIVFY